MLLFGAGLALFGPLVSAGKLLWDGRFNDLASSADLGKWSWGTQVGPYQWYIHGSKSIPNYVNLDASFKNPADKGSQKGVKISIDNTAKWNGQQMWRTELIPQTSAPITKGTVFYHFSMMRKAANAPNPAFEHQVLFFESHFTEMKYGGPGSDGKLHWYIGGRSGYSTPFSANVWHNGAYEINFSSKEVSFWYSAGAAPLKRVTQPAKAGVSSDGKDFHVGVLKLPGAGGGGKEDWYFSGVYIESGPITTSVSGPS